MGDTTSHVVTKDRASESVAHHNGWVIWELCTMGQNASFGVDHVPKNVCELLQTSGWRKFIVPYHDTVVEYGPTEFEQFVEAAPPKGLGQTVEKLKAICGAAKVPESVIAVQLLMEQERALRQHGENQHGGLDNVKSSKKDGNSADYALRRLKRDRPDLAAKVMSGELSTHRAAVIAGFRKEAIQVNRDPLKAASKLIEELGEEEAAKVAQSILKGKSKKR